MRKIFLILLLNCCFWSMVQAQGWIQYYPDYIAGTDGSVHSLSTLDNQFFIAGRNSGDLLFTKTDAIGDTLWTYKQVNSHIESVIGILQLPSDSSYAIIHNRYIHPTSYSYLLRLSATGQFMGSYPVNISTGLAVGSIKTIVELTPEEDILLCSTKDATITGQAHVTLAKVNTQGLVFWDRTYARPTGNEQYAVDIEVTSGGDYVMNVNELGTGTILLKTDSSGVELSRFTPNSNRRHSYDLLITSDGNFLLTGQEEGSIQGNFTTLQKLDTVGNTIWNWSAGPYSFTSNRHQLLKTIELDDGSFVAIGYIGNGGGSFNNVYFVKLSSTGQLLIEKKIQLGGTNWHQGLDIYPNKVAPLNGFTIFGRNQNGTSSGAFLMSVDSTGSVYSNKIVGHYYQDQNNNCLYDSNEPTIPYQVIAANGSNQNHYISTDSTGYYSVEVGLGAYTINPSSISPYWQTCLSQTGVNFANFQEQDTVDIALQPVDSCAYLEVDISTPFLRRCFSSTYHISYQNLGTVEAPNTYVEVTLDPYLTYTSSSIPLIQQNGPIYRFDVGSIPSFGSGSFALEVLVDCDSTALGQVHCTEAHIYPDTLCTGGTWTGPIIRASATCTTDSMTFRLQNVGNGMVSAQNYVIIEEHVMIHQAPYQLGGGMDTLITIPIQRGKFYRIEANQASGFPSYLGNSTAVATNLDCGGLVLLNTPDILGQYYNGNVSPFIAVDCQANRGAYDPNDKNAQPIGYQASHYISNNIPLNYHIRFQNTGTDTAFTVVVVDTLDSHLDLSTLSMGASSHPYTWQLDGNNILTVTFSNIMLPDSNVNEPLSHGFFKFEIGQLPNHPDGTLLYNSAAIYFDFNSPIITNEVFHTIGSNFVVVQTINIDYLKPQYFSVRVFPNPFQQSATFEVESDQMYEALDLQVFNATGQLVQQYQEHSTNRLQMQRRDLPTGIYFYRLSGDQQLLSTGKVVLK